MDAPSAWAAFVVLSAVDLRLCTPDTGGLVSALQAPNNGRASISSRQLAGLLDSNTAGDIQFWLYGRSRLPAATMVAIACWLSGLQPGHILHSSWPPAA